MASARALRDEEDKESWAVARSRRKGGGIVKSAGAPPGAGAVLAFVFIGGIMVLVLTLGGSGGNVPKAGGAFSFASAETGKKPGMFSKASGALSEWVRGVSPVTLQHSFSGGSLTSAASSLSDWSNVTLRAGGTQIDDPRDWIGKTRTSASLRLWNKSKLMQNYQMEFQGQIQKTSLSWAVRAADGSNYYATKLSIIKAGPLPNAGLIRYTVMNGREYDHTQLQLPIVRLERDTDLRVRVTVEGDRILTYLNGSVIGSQRDSKLLRGGVGFFDDSGDPQKIAWVSVSEHDSFLGRMLAHFAMFVIPSEPAR